MKAFFKKNIYHFHRRIALLALVPVLLWTSSGFMHPFMSHWFKPQQAQSSFSPAPIRSQQIQIGIDSVLLKNGLTTIQNVRLVTYEEALYYQIKTKDAELLYFNTQTGNKLPNGDQLYATYLARYYLGETKAAVTNFQLVDSFDEEYREVYKLLPAYKVSFEREDGARVYVHTELSRLGVVIDDRRAFFGKIFSLFHNWSFLGNNDAIRLPILILFSIVCFLAAFTGSMVYGFLWKKLPQTAQRQGGVRKYHRSIGITMSLAMLCFAFSGAFHAFAKINKSPLPLPITASWQIHEVPTLTQLQNVLATHNTKQNVCDIYLAKMDTLALLQVVNKENKRLQTTSIQLATLNTLPDGMMLYAKYLANQFYAAQQGKTVAECCETDDMTSTPTDTDKAQITATQWVTEFKGEYGFINKRLPVVKIQYNTADKLRLYVEPATGHLATSVTTSKAIEGLSFAYLHKYHLFEFLGKNIRDIIMISFSGGNFIVALLGLMVLLNKNRKPKKHQEATSVTSIV